MRCCTTAFCTTLVSWVLSCRCFLAERLGPTSVMEGALVVEAGEKVVMRRIELADRRTNGVVLAVRPPHIAAVLPELNSFLQFVVFGMLCTVCLCPPPPTSREPCP